MAHQTYSLYTNGSEIVGLHMANVPNRMLLQSEHIPCIQWFQKVSLHMSNMPNKLMEQAIALHGVMDIVYIFHILLIHHSYTNLCYKSPSLYLFLISFLVIVE